ncbi:hypothetical protein [Lutibacter sp. Hel_I_33_5]|uniref:hypothetical protein n=1 Tax=Lutibacter sp. Hel_I_33_5 TaxID=1566289 RepID=UPI0021060E83|nr:hypothetical protein [Lutibacter sp. Hel_I_33_5]
MGDTGSLVVGLVLGFLTMKLLSLGVGTYNAIAISRTEIPLLILAVLIIPTFDISRVMFIRFVKKKSIFSPDRNHIHHILIDSGLTHAKASVLIGFINLFIVFLMYYSIKYVGLVLSFGTLFLIIAFLILFFFILNKNYSNKKTKVRFRNFLFELSNFFISKNKKGVYNQNKIHFNKKLKSIRFLFF